MRRLALLACVLLARPAHGAAQEYRSSAADSAAFATLEWRNLGPFRGGRVTAVAGVSRNPMVYYMGAAGGGVWKTDDAGTSWRNISDEAFQTGSVGALVVAEDDPNVIYAGMGEGPIRATASSSGDGVYRSRDAGRSWTHVGLADTRRIPRIVLNPRDNRVVYAAAQGTPWGASEARGVYRSTDGGTAWRRVLYLDSHSGASDLAIDPVNPRILYAALWDHQRTPWHIRSGGPGSGIWKTTDGGDSWTRLSAGLPRGIMGKIGLSVSPANPNRIYAIIEADEGGLYRSDDAGGSFELVNSSRKIRARAWYFSHVTADPVTPDVVYLPQAPPIYRSADGGRTFEAVRSPHDDNHTLWINPSTPATMIAGNDGGASVSFNGGRTWSTQMNQPTGQIYRLGLDHGTPYRLYGAQQDNTTVAISSRTGGQGIARVDWEAQAGCESGWIGLNPDAPRFTYAGCYQGVIEEFDNQTRRSRNIQAWPALVIAEPSDSLKYRFNWNAPIIVSAFDDRVIYHAANVLLRSPDRGQHWEAISPDLTRNDRSRQGWGGGPLTNEGSGGEIYGTISYLAESSDRRGEIWAGTDDGLIQLTRDGGRTWHDITPPGAGESLVNSIELSPGAAGRAIVVMTRYKFDDDTPQVYRTGDFGATWTSITRGVLPGDFIRVVREDPARSGLLFAGSERGVYASFDDGNHWISLQLNLPHLPVTDLRVYDHDLLASTEGRGFWVLDDISVLEQWSDTARAAPAYLFSPRPLRRLDRGPTFDDPEGILGRNPRSGALLHFDLRDPPDSNTDLRLEIRDSAGAVVRGFSSTLPATGPTRDDNPDHKTGPGSDAHLTLRQGVNLVEWDLRTVAPTAVPGLTLWGELLGYQVPPGDYTVRLIVGDRPGRPGATLVRTLQVLPDTRAAATPAGYAERTVLLRRLVAWVDEIHQAVNYIRGLRTQVIALRARSLALPGGAALDQAEATVLARADSLEQYLVQPRLAAVLDAINFRNGLSDQVLYLKDVIESSDPPITQGARTRADELESVWTVQRARIRRLVEDVAALNALALKLGVPAVTVPPRPEVVPDATVPR